MDNYTKDIKLWLDRRFKDTDQSGVYLAHQPIYGFRNGPTEPNTTSRYIITFQIMKALSHLRFKTFLDVGGAEGYKAALVRSVFDAEVLSCDLSQEACLRAKEIYDIEGEAVDIHSLPFEDNQFDVVLCSETLEHVADLEAATRELLRVCSKAVVITVPHEPMSVVRRNISQNIAHGHIHSLDVDSFSFTVPPATRIVARKMLSSFLRIPCALVDGVKRGKVTGYPDFLIKLNNLFVPLFRFLFGERTACLMVSFDSVLSKFTPFYDGFSLILLKNEDSYSKDELRHISPGQIVGFKVPYHYIKNK